MWEETDDGIIVKKSGALDGYGSFASELTADEREELASDLETELYESRRTAWTE